MILIYQILRYINISIILHISYLTSNISCQERYHFFKSNPALIICFFSAGIFKEIILDGLLGKTCYYYVSFVLFKVCCSPHVYTFTWILNALKLTKKMRENILSGQI